MTEYGYYGFDEDGTYVHVPKVEDICAAIRVKFKDQEKIIDCQAEQIKKLQAENWKDEKLQELQTEIERLQNCFNNCFEISEGEQAEIDEWIKDHECHNGGAIGGAFTYCFTPTSIGTFASIKCKCGQQFVFRDLC